VIITSKAVERSFICYDYFFFKDTRGPADSRRVMHLLRPGTSAGKAAVLPDLRQEKKNRAHGQVLRPA